jgi:hypothetical protein
VLVNVADASSPGPREKLRPEVGGPTVATAILTALSARP